MRHEQLVARIEARVARRKARATAPKRRSAVKANPVKHRRGLLRLNAEVRAMPAHIREAYAVASPEVRLLIREQVKDDATVVIKGGPSLDDALAWKSA